ncbi:MAG: DUF2207 domain-containing protein [Gemmatimonadaceae bacterium]
MIRALNRWILWSLAVTLSASGGHAQERSIRLSEFDAVLEVGADGVMDVTERLTVAFTGQWNGIVRELSLQHNTAQGRSVRLDLDIGEITDGAGQPLRVERESGDGTRKLRIYVPGARDAERLVVIRYRVTNAIRFFYEDSDAGALDELYWNVTGNYWDMPIARVRARVTLPAGVRATRAAVYTGGSGSTAAEADIDTTGNVVTFTTRRELQPFEGMTIGVGWPPGHIASRPSETEHATREVVRWWPVLLPFLVFFLAFRTWHSRGRDPKEQSITVTFEPVGGLSPAETGTLVDHRAEMHDITSTLVDLAVRGFLRIEEQTEKRLLGLLTETEYEFHLLHPRRTWAGLTKHEERYLDALFSGADSVRLSELQNNFYKSLPEIRNALYEQLIEHGYYVQRPDSVKHNWLALAAIVLFAGGGLALLAASRGSEWVSPAALFGAAGVSTVLLLVFANLMPARTEAGARAREAALGFREFLNRVESDRYRRMITSPEMFERFLPYAMAFQVEEKWARAFEDIYRDPPSWYTGSGMGHFSAATFSSKMSSLSSSASSAMSSSPSSSGSGGGGSSGGGSGGGGGSGF